MGMFRTAHLAQQQQMVHELRMARTGETPAEVHRDEEERLKLFLWFLSGFAFPPFWIIAVVKFRRYRRTLEV